MIFAYCTLLALFSLVFASNDNHIPGVLSSNIPDNKDILSHLISGVEDAVITTCLVILELQKNNRYEAVEIFLKYRGVKDPLVQISANILLKLLIMESNIRYVELWFKYNHFPDDQTLELIVEKNNVKVFDLLLSFIDVDTANTIYMGRGSYLWEAMKKYDRPEITASAIAKKRDLETSFIRLMENAALDFDQKKELSQKEINVFRCRLYLWTQNGNCDIVSSFVAGHRNRAWFNRIVEPVINSVFFDGSGYSDLAFWISNQLTPSESYFRTLFEKQNWDYLKNFMNRVKVGTVQQAWFLNSSFLIRLAAKYGSLNILLDFEKTIGDILEKPFLEIIKSDEKPLIVKEFQSSSFLSLISSGGNMQLLIHIMPFNQSPASMLNVAFGAIKGGHLDFLKFLEAHIDFQKNSTILFEMALSEGKINEMEWIRSQTMGIVGCPSAASFESNVSVNEEANDFAVRILLEQGSFMNCLQQVSLISPKAASVTSKIHKKDLFDLDKAMIKSFFRLAEQYVKKFPATPTKRIEKTFFASLSSLRTLAVFKMRFPDAFSQKSRKLAMDMQTQYTMPPMDPHAFDSATDLLSIT